MRYTDSCTELDRCSEVGKIREVGIQRVALS